MFKFQITTCKGQELGTKLVFTHFTTLTKLICKPVSLISSGGRSL